MAESAEQHASPIEHMKKCPDCRYRLGGRLGHLKITDQGGQTLFWVLCLDIGGLAFAKKMKDVIQEKRDAYLARETATP